MTDPPTARANDQVTGAGRRAGSAIATALMKRGWAGSSRLTGEDYPYTDLSKRYDGYTVGLSVQVFEDSVVVDGYTRYRRVCRSDE